LFRADDGTWCGIARWPDRETREAAPRSPELHQAGACMAAAIELHVETLELTEDLNLWTAYKPRE
jgi:hypothetical protein